MFGSEAQALEPKQILLLIPVWSWAGLYPQRAMASVAVGVQKLKQLNRSLHIDADWVRNSSSEADFSNNPSLSQKPVWFKSISYIHVPLATANAEGEYTLNISVSYQASPIISQFNYWQLQHQNHQSVIKVAPKGLIYFYLSESANFLNKSPCRKHPSSFSSQASCIHCSLVQPYARRQHSKCSLYHR